MKTIKKIFRLIPLNKPAIGERGFAMVEILVALALLGVAGVCFLSSLTTVSHSTFNADERSNGDSLAISQMEYVLSQTYDDTNNPPEYAIITDVPDGWSVNMTAERLDPENDGTGDDDGIQKISVAVNSGSEQIVSITSRKVDIAYVP